VLLRWFAREKRSYPWRNEKDPYKKLIAEVMLQRTRANQVLPVYKSFIKKFPDIDSLHMAQKNEIDKFISKLGLMWRTKLIMDLASTVKIKLKGKIPTIRDELLELPGVGDYIADAMLVFAFAKKRTVIDGNVVRLVSRFFGIEKRGEMRRNKKFIDFCQQLSSDLEKKNIKNFNYGLIDFGAFVCKPHPLCEVCPLSTKCQYFLKRKL